MYRIERVSELLKEEISKIVQQEIKDPKVHDVVITSVEVTKDLSNSKIYFTTYDKNIMDSVQKGLERSSGYIKRQLIKRLRIKRIPELNFVQDKSGQYGDYIDNLLREIK